MNGTVDLADRCLCQSARHFGISLGHTCEAEAESWVRSLGVPAPAEVCIHRARAPYEHVALSIALPAGTVMELPPMDGRFAAAAMRACTAHAAGRSGRAIRFRGDHVVTGRVRVAAVLGRTDIARVSVPGGVADYDEVDAGDGVVPCWVNGVLTLATARRPDGVLVPLPGFRRR